ncbi:MAG: outer membrane protein assembly factor BamA [Candidatus Nitrospinota bacterium M3_3B_026]
MKKGLRRAGLLLLALTLAPVTALAVDFAKPIKSIRIKGTERADQNTIRYYIHSRVGGEYDPSVAASDIKRIYKLGFFDDIKLDVAEEPDGLILTFIFKEKPFVRDVIITDAEEVEQQHISVRLKTKKGAFFRQDQIPWDQERIQRLYRSKGYYFTGVRTVVKKLGGNQVDVEFIIDEGRKITISRIDFRGAKAFPPRTLQGVIQTEEADWMSLFSDAGAYKKEVLKTDLLRLESFYHDHGYIKVKVYDPEVEIDREKRKIYVSIPVSEGDQYHVGSIEIQGDDVYTKEELSEKVDLAPGDVFDRSRFRRDIFEISDMYSQKGYAFANVVPELEVNDEKNTVDISVRTEKGRKVYVGKITITGNEKTRDRVIRREFRLHEGELFNSAKLRRSRERINNLAYFENVEIEQRSRRELDMVDLEVQVVERSTGQISFGAGYSSVENLLLQGQVKWPNFMGKGQTLSLSLDSSARRTDFNASFTEPRLFDRELMGGVDAYNKLFIWDSYDSRDVGGSFRVGRSFGEYLWARLGYTYEKNEITVRDRERASSYLLEQEGVTTIGSFLPSVTYDTRNDPFNPSAGQRMYGSLEIAGAGGEERFYRTTGEYTVYKSLWLDFVTMLHAKVGFADDYSGQGLPISKRYFMGGPRSLRGFTYRNVGPLDVDGEAIGGEALLLLNVELQYGFTRYFRGFVFYDRGNVYGSNDARGNTTDRYYDLEDMRHSWGAGIRFFSPIGPITIAYGFKLDQRSGETPNEFHFTIGGAF